MKSEKGKREKKERERGRGGGGDRSRDEGNDTRICVHMYMNGVYNSIETCKKEKRERRSRKYSE